MTDMRRAGFRAGAGGPRDAGGDGSAGDPARDAVRHGHGRLLTYAGLGLVILALGAWAVWVALADTPEAAAQLRYSTVQSDHAVTVHFEVAKPADETATCTVLATGVDGEPIGRTSVTVPTGTSRTVLSKTLHTDTHAAASHVGNCRLSR